MYYGIIEVSCFLADDVTCTAQYFCKRREKEELVPWRVALMHAVLLKTCDTVIAAKIQVILYQ